MNRHLQAASRNWSPRPFSGSERIKRTSVFANSCSFVFLAAILSLTTTGARAASVLPNPVSYEYFGFNFVTNLETSSAVGTLTYTGDPGCGGTCVATTQLGSDPSVSLNVNEVVFENTAGGGAIAELGYYFRYVNTPGTYMVHMLAPESLSITDGSSNAFAFLELGPGDLAGTFNDFNSYTLREADCVSFGCQHLPIAGVTPAPFVADQLVQITANTPYFVLLDVEIDPSPTQVQLMASIDPQFSTTAAGGFFEYSPGVTDASASPEPGALVLMLSGCALLGGLRRRRR